MSNANIPSEIELEKVAFWKWLQEKSKKEQESSYEPIQLEIELPMETPSTSSYEPSERGTQIINYEIDHDVYSSGSVVFIFSGNI